MLSNRDIDWNGDCNFVDGKVVSFVTNKSTNHYHMRPIPTKEETVQEAKQAMITLEAIMQPASYEQMAVVFKRLSSHCGKVNKSPEDIKYMFNDYYADLGKYPIKLIEEACEKYRKLPEGNEFMPSSGKLIELMREKLGRMLFLKSRIEKILGTYVEPVQRQNRTLSLDEALDKLI